MPKPGVCPAFTVSVFTVGARMRCNLAEGHSGDWHYDEAANVSWSPDSVVGVTSVTWRSGRHLPGLAAATCGGSLCPN